MNFGDTDGDDYDSGYCEKHGHYEWMCTLCMQEAAKGRVDLRRKIRSAYPNLATAVIKLNQKELEELAKALGI